MKKIILSIVAFATMTGAGARTLTPEEALQRVASGALPMKIAAPGGAEASAKLLHTTFTSRGEAAVYIFDKATSGYMIVSADDVAWPLLGYSDEPLSQGGELPPQMQWWLGQYAAEIEQAQENGVLPLTLRAAGSTNLGVPVQPLCKTLWNQDSPYNMLCPKEGSSATMTGCVATAMAQVLKYHEWPVKGKGSVDYTDSNGTRRTLNFSTTTYSWDKMLDSYTGTATTSQKQAVALLMRNCGYAVRMTYGAESSGASDIYIVPALTENFDYDKGARLCQRSNYGLAQWQEMIYKNLTECGPVLYCGSSHLGGHAFVCDGYSTDGFFHFNWGWGGAYDGYYRLTALNPEGQGIGGFTGGYNLSQSIVLGIRKPTGSDVTANVQLEQMSALEGSVANGVLTLSGGWVNYTGYDIRFELGLKAEATGGTTGATRFIPSSYGTLSMGNGTYFDPLQFPVSSLPEGTWRLSVVTRPEGSATDASWQESLHAINQPGFVTVTRSGSQCKVVNGTVANLKVTSAELLSGLYNGCMAKMRFTVTNPNDVEVAQVIEPVLASGSSVVGEAGGEMIDLMPGETETREVTFQLDYFTGFKLNTNYDFCLFDPYSDLVLYDLGKQMVKAYPGTPTLTIGKFALAGGNYGVNPENMEFSATVKCSKGSLAAPLQVLITPNGGGNVLATGNSDALFLNEGEFALPTIDVAFAGAENGVTYTAFLCFEDILGRQTLSSLNFTVETSGVAVVEDSQTGIAMTYDHATATAMVVSDAGGLNVVAVDTSGLDVRAMVEVSADGKSAVVNFRDVPKGVVILMAKDADGESRAMKVAL